MRIDNKLFIYSNGRVAAIDKKSGDIVWEIKLKEYAKGTMAMGYAVGQIVLDEDKLIVTVSGIMFCLRAKDGSLVWKNDLKGWGYSFVSIAGASGSENAAAIAAAQAGSAATSSSAVAASS